MKIKYDREEDILMIELKQNDRIDHAEQVESLILHLTEADEPILLEILHASDLLIQALAISLQPEEASVR